MTVVSMKIRLPGCGYGRSLTVGIKVSRSAGNGCRYSIHFPPLRMETETLCTACGHARRVHFTETGAPHPEGCLGELGITANRLYCGCRSREDAEFREVTLHEFRFRNEWTLRAENEDDAERLFADALMDFAAGADMEKLPEDYGSITCPDYEWTRIVTEDIQQKAQDILGRRLTRDELELVAKTFRHALQSAEVIEVAIDVALSWLPRQPQLPQLS